MSAKPTSAPGREGYFAEAIDWDADKRAQEARTRDAAVRIAWFAGILAVVEAVAIIVMLPLKSVEQVIIRVDRQTGQYDTQVGALHFDINDQANENTIRADLANYVIHREAFTRGEAENNYASIFWTSCGDVRENWDAYMRPDRNKNSPINTLTLADADRVEVNSITPLPSDNPALHAAQIRWALTKQRSNLPTTKQNYISTATFKYDRRIVPNDVTNLHYNPLGFCVTSYRKDQDGLPSTVPNEIVPPSK